MPSLVRFIIKRLSMTVIILFFVSIIAFGLIRIAPGNPAMLVLPDGAPEEAIRAMEVQLGLDQPLVVQYFRYIGDMLHGDLGTSIIYKIPVRDLIFQRLPATFKLTIITMIVCLLISIPLGIIAGCRQGTSVDFFATMFALLGQSMSTVWMGILVTERAIGNVLNGLSLKIHKGESMGLVGETGAGKTTTALSILNLLPQPAGKIIGGEIIYNGKSVAEMTQNELMDIRGNRISMIFQNPLTSLNPVFTIGEQIGMVIRKHEKCSKAEADKKVMELLEKVGIPGARLKDYPNQFSGGMRQRVGIAAGIALNPELLIADEPTTALDVTIQAQILELMKRLKTQYDTSLLMITHNLGIISELCENVSVIYAGRIIEYGSVKEVFGNPKHPYTRGLLGAIPSLEGKKERLHAIPGKIL